MAEMTGSLFPLSFLSAALIVSCSAYSYVKLSNAYPSTGGIAMYLVKAYGKNLTTVFHALLMYFSMLIAQSFLARTFGAYTLQLFAIDDSSLWVPVLGGGLLLVAFLINLSANRLIQGVASTLGFIKIGGLVLFGVVGVLAADSVDVNFSTAAPGASLTGFLGATALGILALKGFTTIASIFAVSRILAMLTEMKLVPHRHFHMPGSIQKHTLVYTVMLGMLLNAFFDLSRIVALGITLYLIIDIAIHWGVLRHLRKEIDANPVIPVLAINLDLIVLSGFLWVKVASDPLILIVVSTVMAAILITEFFFLRKQPTDDYPEHSQKTDGG